METTDWVFPPFGGRARGGSRWPGRAASCLETIAAFVSFACCGQTQYTVGAPCSRG